MNDIPKKSGKGIAFRIGIAAVILAVICAIMIPLFIGVNKKLDDISKKNETDPFVFDMLSSMLRLENGEADILVFSENDGKITVYGYDASRKSILYYCKNTINRAIGVSLDDQSDMIASQMLADGAIIYNDDVKSDNKDDWRTKENVKTMIDGLGDSLDLVCVYAHYEIIYTNFTDGEKSDSCEHDVVHQDAVAPTCLSEGCIENFLCKKCGRRYADANCTIELDDVMIPALGHSMKPTAQKDPTCTESGHTNGETCERCGYTTTETIPVLGHDFGAWQVVKAAKCTTTGLEKRACNRCDAYETRVIAAKGHHYDNDDWCFDTRVHWHECENCGEEFDEGRHIFPNGSRICSICGYKKSGPLWELIDGRLYYNGNPHTGLNTSDPEVGEGGMYYDDGWLANKTIEDGDNSYTFINGRLTVTDRFTRADIRQIENSANTMYGYYYNVDHHVYFEEVAKYTTKEVYVDTHALSVNTMGVQVKQVFDIRNNKYSATSVVLTLPKLDGDDLIADKANFSSNIRGWNAADVENYLSINGDTDKETIPYIIASDTFKAYLGEVYSTTNYSDATRQYLDDYKNGTLATTYTAYLEREYGELSSWTYEKALEFIYSAGDCISVDGNRVQMVEPEIIELALKAFYVSAYDTSYVAVYDSNGIVDPKSIGIWEGEDYSGIYYTVQGYDGVKSISVSGGIKAVEIITPKLNNFWNGVKLLDTNMRIVLTNPNWNK